MLAVPVCLQLVQPVTEEGFKVVAEVSITTNNNLRLTPLSHNIDLPLTAANSNLASMVEVNQSPTKDHQPWALEALRSSTLNPERRTWVDRFTWCSPGCHKAMDI